MRSPAGLVTEISIDCGLWSRFADIEDTVCSAINAAARLAMEPSSASSEISVLLTSDTHSRELNRIWRDQDEPTNVLSFPATTGRQRNARPDLAAVPMPEMLGDIVVAFETTEREARDEGKPLQHHLSHLIVHGFLHLLGHDHEEPDDAEAMEGAERTILRELGIPDPYADRP